MNRKYTRALTLVGPTRQNLEQDPPAVLHLHNQPSTYNQFVTRYTKYEKRKQKIRKVLKFHFKRVKIILNFYFLDKEIAITTKSENRHKT